MGQIRKGDLRVEDHGTDVESAERSVCSARGDKILILHARVDDDGNPTGNRQERRLGKRLLRRQK